MSELAMKTDRAVKPDLEAVGAKFNEEQMLFVRQRTRNAIHEIAARVKPGMVEEDAVEMAKDLLANLGMLKGWHDVYVRFGTNTLKTFGAASDPGVILGENDVFFIDIGPVWKDWEGDGGDTFVVGSAKRRWSAAPPTPANCSTSCGAQVGNGGLERQGSL